MREELEYIVDGRSPAAQREIANRARTELLLRRRENPLKYYVPNGKIEEVINEVGDNLNKWIYILAAANKVGKTSGAINILGNIIFGPQSKWFDKERFRNWTHPKKFWYVSEHETLKNVVTGVDGVNGEIIKWFPKGRYTLTKGGRDFYSSIVTDTGWTGTFMTYDQDISQFESDNCGLILLDEPPPRPIYSACLARLLFGGGIVLMPMTPLGASAWVFDDLIPRATPESHIYVLYADVESNCKLCGVRGQIDHENIQKIIGEYSDEERDARAHGTSTHLKGLVYKGIHPSTNRHNKPPHEFTQDKFLIYNVVDPHDARPPFIGWFAVDQWGVAWAIDEYPNEEFHKIKSFNKTTLEVCTIIKKREQDNGWDGSKIQRVMDPNFGAQKQQTVGMTTRDYFDKCGKDIEWPLWYSLDVNDSLADGHRLVRDYFAISADGNTKMRIGENCPNLWYQATHYSYYERTGKALEIHGSGDRVAEKFKDGADVIRYFIQALRLPQIAPPRDEREWVQSFIKDANEPPKWEMMLG